METYKKSGLKKIRELDKQRICKHPEHNPPGHIVLPPGVYEHTCPACGIRIVFTVTDTGL